MIMITIFTITEFNTLAADDFNARLAWVNLVSKTNFDAKLSSLKKNYFK